jgi:uncharacterized protein YecE (DUF72 family)
MRQPGRIWIGTSNILVPGNKQSFPVPYRLTSRLRYYSHLFTTLEINSCFYKTPMPATYEKWSQDVPDDFCFSIKLSKEITHAKDLRNNLHTIEIFLKAAKRLGEKKGCLLIQFPGKITLDYFKQVEEIIMEVAEHDPGREWRKAIEFRNPTWYVGETYELLEQYDGTLVLHDIPKAKIFDLPRHSNFVYIRFHGPKGDYRDSYTEEFLRERATQIIEWARQGKDVYVYFNNSIGSAFDNATRLKNLVAVPARLQY